MSLPRLVAVGVAILVSAAASAQPNPGASRQARVGCASPCEDDCVFETFTVYGYSPSGTLISVRLGHRKVSTPAGCNSDISPGASTVSWTIGGNTQTFTFNPEGQTNDPGNRNNVNDFTRDLMGAGWDWVENDGVNSMQLAGAGAISGLSFNFKSILICTCKTEDGDGNLPTATRTTTTTGVYSGQASGPNDTFDPGTISVGKTGFRPTNFGIPYESTVYSDSEIAPASRVLPGQVLNRVMHFPPPGPPAPGSGLPFLLVKAYNIRDAQGTSDVRLFVDNLPVSGAFDAHDMDEDVGMGGVQIFRFPREGALGNAVADGQVQLRLEYAASDGQFIALDFLARIFHQFVAALK
ncbi:hypothetical protein RAS1_32140 [Phycisphaerae bacterium RAS1]|nr:hypothetical protein RAS1_32140 [Phycisphaerae bacterium RAS1]